MLLIVAGRKQEIARVILSRKLISEKDGQDPRGVLSDSLGQLYS